MSFQSPGKIALLASFIIIPEVLWGPLLSIVFEFFHIPPTVPPLYFPIPDFFLAHDWLFIIIILIELAGLAGLWIVAKKHWQLPGAVKILLNVSFGVLIVIIFFASFIAWGFSRL